MAAVWDVLRCWARDNPPKALSETSPAPRILATPPATEADFTPLPEARALLDKKGKDGQKIHRFPPTPAEWGPGSLRTAHYSLGEGAEEEATPAKRARLGGSELGGRAGTLAAGESPSRGRFGGGARAGWRGGGAHLR